MKHERWNDGLHVTRMERVSGRRQETGDRRQVRLSSDSHSHSKVETCVNSPYIWAEPIAAHS